VTSWKWDVLWRVNVRMEWICGWGRWGNLRTRVMFLSNFIPRLLDESFAVR
jgi:hypothetical protein